MGTSNNGAVQQKTAVGGASVLWGPKLQMIIIILVELTPQWQS